MTVAACLIVRDSVAGGLEECIASVRPHVDEVCVYENGSTDGTPQLLERLASEPGAPIIWESGTWNDDFAAARERSFALASTDWAFAIDADDTLIGGENLRALIDAAGDATTIYAAYDYEDPRPNVEQWLWWPRVVRRGTGRWVGAVHERWQPDDGSHGWRLGVGVPDTVHAHPARFRVFHRDRNRPGGWKYLPALERAVKAPERTPRAARYLGNQLASIDLPRAIEMWRRYLDENMDADEGDPNVWRAEVLQRLAQAYQASGQHGEAMRYRQLWDAYSQRVTKAFGRDLDARMSLDDSHTLAWAEMDPAEADVLLDLSPPTPRVAAPAVGRNDPCPCGSGLKFKKCHGG